MFNLITLLFSEIAHIFFDKKLQETESLEELEKRKSLKNSLNIFFVFLL